MMTSDPTTTDAVTMLQRLHARTVHSENRGDVPRIGSDEVLAVLRATEAERARHAEEVARLEERLAVQERATNHCGTVLGEQKRRISDLESENDDLRSSVRSANVTALSALSGAGISTPEEGFPAAGWGELGNCIVRLAKDRDSLRDQLRKVEGERDALAVRMDLPASQLLMVGSELCGDGKIDPNDHRDPRWTPTLQQAAKVMRELTSLRALLPDVRECAEYCRNMIGPPPGMPVEDYPLPPVALAARRILAALDSHECPECHRRSDHKMSCSRGGSKGGRFRVRLDSQGGEGE